MKRIKLAVIRLVSEWILQVVRSYFTGRTVHHLTRIDGQALYRGEGMVVGGVIRRDPRRTPTGMDLFLAIPGQSSQDMKRFSIRSVEYHKQLGWVFYE